MAPNIFHFLFVIFDISHLHSWRYTRYIENIKYRLSSQVSCRFVDALQCEIANLRISIFNFDPKFVFKSQLVLIQYFLKLSIKKSSGEMIVIEQKISTDKWGFK